MSTLETHAGYTPEAPHRSISVPIHATSAYAYSSHGELRDVFARQREGFAYSRSGNPTTAVLERRVAALEGGIAGIAVASGQAAVAVTLLALLAPGTHLVASDRLYGGTIEFFDDTLADVGVSWTGVNAWDLDAVEAAFTEKTRVLLVESITNPGAHLVDLDALTDIAHRNGAVVVVDNTVASPALYRPGEHGADFVVHSATKYLAGHGTTIAGVIVDTGRFDPRRCPERWSRLVEPNRRFGVCFSDEYEHGGSGALSYARAKYVTDLGVTLPAQSASQVLLGIDTLSLRMDRISASSAYLAQALATRPEVLRVHHPHIGDRPDASLAQRDFPRGLSGVFSFDLAGDAKAVEKFLDSLRLITLAVNIGDARTLAVHPASTTHCHLSRAQRESCGVNENTIRLSIGLEDVTDLEQDLTQALVQSQR
ncbi:O-acetylhomoserine aminocarboxypropyltransferase/cysteine synthase family protein [Devriesea agamarum]|uniref:O-acetylhomoserine aminocarboxypropyltransferase/cysteine synthase family protein n=1 Tax=Devriesea agamarum TaxID=472569 RepID=UPI00071CB66D|nr:aminotransferase class I/II-fold pyridoxal phosphate-dependent enzyme [Devriesea agamarum]